MIYYTKENETFKNIKDKLKPTICKSCEADGHTFYGTCADCLKNQAYNKEYAETHLFIVDEEFRPYHSGGSHNVFKSMVYRMPNEKPYLYYGIEVEVEFDEDCVYVFQRDEDDYYDDNEDPSDDIQEILKKFSEITEGMFIYEKDGSLTNGVEFISRPMSYAKWVDKDTVKKMREGFDYLARCGAVKEQPNSNGMHIHISKKFFDYGEKKREYREDAYKDMDWLFQFYQNELEKIGGRKYTAYCDSKMNKIKSNYNIGRRNENHGMYNVELEIKGKMKKGGRMAEGDHYSAVSLSGPTIEARIFNSTIDVNHILANIELMRNFAHAVREEDIEGKTLNNILHTKDNLYLDDVLNETRKKCYKSKEEFDLERVNTNEMEIK